MALELYHSDGTTPTDDEIKSASYKIGYYKDNIHHTAHNKKYLVKHSKWSGLVYDPQKIITIPEQYGIHRQEEHGIDNEKRKRKNSFTLT